MSLRPILAIAPLADDFVVLRSPDPRDIGVIARYIVGDDAQAWLSGTADAAALYSEYAAGWRAPDAPNRLGLTLVVAQARDGELVGVVHLEPRGDVLHVAYGIAPDRRRVGVASRALDLCSRWALDHAFASVDLEIGEENVPSQGVARRCGFVPTSQTRQQRLPDGGNWVARAWSRTRAEGVVTPSMPVVVLVPGYRGRFRAVERWRVGVAVATLAAHGGGQLIVSGHRGEAERLAALVPACIAVVVESAAASTFENVKFSLPCLRGADKIAIASDHFHVRRATAYLRQLDPNLAARVVGPNRNWWRGWWMDAGGAAYEVLLRARRLRRSARAV